MAETVTVALLGNPEHAFDNRAFTWHEDDDEGGARELDVPWEELPKVVLEVEETETIYEVLARALRESDVRLPDYFDPDDPILSWVMFYAEDVKPSFKRFHGTLTVVDENGRAHWGVRYKDVTYGQLLRSARAGTIDGDPRRPYLILLPEQGNGTLFTWSELLEGIRIAWMVMGGMATVGGALTFGKKIVDTVRDRLGKGHEVLQERYLEWDERGATPDNFEEMLGLGPWHGADLAERLDCSMEEAEAILWAFGYAKASSGLWRKDEDESAKLLHLVNDDLRLSQAWNPSANFEAEMKRRTQGLLETGKPLPEPTNDVLDEDYEVEDTETPLEEGLAIPCSCGCGTQMEIFRFYPARGDGETLVKFRFSNNADHFVIDPMALGTILGGLAR